MFLGFMLESRGGLSHKSRDLPHHSGLEAALRKEFGVVMGLQTKYCDFRSDDKNGLDATFPAYVDGTGTRK